MLEYDIYVFNNSPRNFIVCPNYYAFGSQGGEPDLTTAAKMVLHDWQRGKIPFFVPPPQQSEDGASESAEPVERTEEDGVSSDRTAAAMKAIAGIISLQQNKNIPCHKEHDADNQDIESENEDIESEDDEDKEQSV